MPATRPIIAVMDQWHEAPMSWPCAPGCEWCRGPLLFRVTDYFDGSDWCTAGNPFPGFLDVLDVEGMCPHCLANTGAEIIAIQGGDVAEGLTRWAQEFVILAPTQAMADDLRARWAREDLEARWHREHPVLPGLEVVHA